MLVMPVTSPGGSALQLGFMSQTGPSREGAPCWSHGATEEPTNLCWCLTNRKAKGCPGSGLLQLKHAAREATSGHTVPLRSLCSSSGPDSHRRKPWWDFLGCCLVAIWHPHALHAVCGTSAGLPRLFSEFLHSVR